MNDSDVDRLIDKTHMRTTKRISQHIRHDHPEVTDKQIDKVNKARPKSNICKSSTCFSNGFT